MCIRREVKEETDIDVRIEGVIGTYTDPMTRIAYTDGEVRREFSILFWGHPEGQDVTLDDESTHARWVAIDDLEKLQVSASQRRRLNDVVEYLNSGRVFIR